MTVTDEYDGDNFFTVVDGVKKATPLLLVLAVIEISDVVFAVDSIPAVRFLLHRCTLPYGIPTGLRLLAHCEGVWRYHRSIHRVVFKHVGADIPSEPVCVCGCCYEQIAFP